MYVRDAKKREEVWLLDRLEEFGFEDPAFRSRDYVVVIDEQTGEKVGFGRLRVHKDGGEAICELTNIGVLPEARGQGVGAHVVERLVELARDQDFDVVYSLTPTGDYLEQFGFDAMEEADLPDRLQDRLASIRERVDSAAHPYRIDVDDFGMPPRIRRRFRLANEEDEPEEKPEDFGIDPDEAKYKYDTGRR